MNIDKPAWNVPANDNATGAALSTAFDLDCRTPPGLEEPLRRLGYARLQARRK